MKAYYCEEKHNTDKYLYMNVDNVTEIKGMHLIIPEWLRVDIGSSVNVVEEIKKALNNDKEECYFWSNLYYATFTKECSIIKSNFYEEGDEKMCSLPTKLLLEIVEEWLKEYKKFKDENA